MAVLTFGTVIFSLRLLTPLHTQAFRFRMIKTTRYPPVWQAVAASKKQILTEDRRLTLARDVLWRRLVSRAAIR